MTFVRAREYSTEDEVHRLLAAAKKTPRHSLRNYCLILTTYRHGLRATEAAELKWHQIDFTKAVIHVKRLKDGNNTVHPIYGDELRSLRQLERERKSAYVFASDRADHITGSGFRQIIAALGRKAGIDFPVHPHMLRHSCGYYLANKGYDTRLIQDWLGHVNIACTVGYTRLSHTRFEGVFE